ncbi:Dynamitin [Dictyocaulus viviparus]|uniref:Dynamitin n=1 Tax=Dictyocaulus viviparus TaxID=29172 RepID=A0A0D8XUG6_DICVI|nr:Dynamitin [Dictyocaulus viviparus]
MSVSGKEDVYESEDLPESEQFLNKFSATTAEEPLDRENIELIHIDIDAAKRRFKDRTINARDVDFSDSIAKKRGKSYGSSMYVLEIVGKDYEEPETVEQKYNRLSYEIADLAKQLQAIKPSLIVNESTVAELADELKAVKVLKSTGNILQHKEKSDVSLRADTSSNAKLLSLDQRLRRIETLVGSVDPAHQPIADCVEDIRFRLEALNPSYIDVMESKLNAVMSKLDQVDDKRQKIADDEMEAKVNELLGLMNKWDVVCAAMPINVKRLQGLHRLHEQAQHFSERLSQLIGIRDQIEKDDCCGSNDNVRATGIYNVTI